jgi:uncharacterized protein YodC (DUF2158 family)
VSENEYCVRCGCERPCDCPPAASAPRFAPGSIVRVKGIAGPDMVVAAGDASLYPYVRCRWFNTALVFAEEHFLETLLEAVGGWRCTLCSRHFAINESFVHDHDGKPCGNGP